ncbi:MAG: DUF3604 domain-containing protein [Alteromonadaceae bacterium]|nr:DUF3604 domain-containing protein [Alteromonadaceae bacterium]
MMKSGMVFIIKKLLPPVVPVLPYVYLADGIFPADLHTQENGIATAYEQGVPMGGDLTPIDVDATTTPKFLVMAMRGSDSANLDRIQIIKGWLKDDDTVEERIYNVVWADPEKRAFADGLLASLENTVNVAQATYTHHHSKCRF